MPLQSHPVFDAPPSQAAPLGTTVDPTRTVSVLALSTLQEDHLDLKAIFQHSNWTLYSAHSCQEGLAFLRTNTVPVVITEGELANYCWKHVLDEISSLPRVPLPRLVVASRLADDRLWSEVLNLGGYNVLEKPFAAKEVFWVVSHAWLDWKTEWERTSLKHQLATARG